MVPPLMDGVNIWRNGGSLSRFMLTLADPGGLGGHLGTHTHTHTLHRLPPHLQLDIQLMLEWLWMIR